MDTSSNADLWSAALGTPGARLGAMSTRRLYALSRKEILAIPGMGRKKALAFRAILELGRRLSSVDLPEDAPIDQPQQVFDAFSPLLCHEAQEHFYLLLLDNRNRVRAKRLVSLGGWTSAVIHPREVFRLAVQEGAGSIILVHNHPSGDPTPSLLDIDLTKRLSQAGKLMNIPILDHVVIGAGTYTSFKGSGLLP